jgi:hypothetical protein
MPVFAAPVVLDARIPPTLAWAAPLPSAARAAVGTSVFVSTRSSEV